MDEVKHISTGYIPRPYQAEVHIALSEKRFAVLVFHRRAGKCLATNTPVYTPEGFKQIGDIRVGDLVYSIRGTPTQVLGTFSNGVQETYRVEFTNGEVIETDADHLWYVEKSFSNYPKPRIPWLYGDLKTTKALYDGALEEGWKFIPKASPISNAEKDLPIEPWFLGYWLGNGSKDTVTITIGYSEIEELTLKHPVLLTASKVSDYGKGCKRFYFSGVKSKFRELNLLFNKHIPEIYFNSSIEQREQLLQGLMDSDGSSTDLDVKVSCRFSNLNKTLIDDVNRLLSTLGEKSHVRESLRLDKEEAIRKKEYTIAFSPKVVTPFSLNRKLKGARINSSPTRHKIKSITHLQDKKQEFICIKVDSPDSLFLVGNSLIPTHNTILAVNEVIDVVLNCPLKNPQGAYIAPTYQQAKRIAWTYFKDYVKDLPNEDHYEGELRIVIPRPWRNDFATIFLAGSDNYDNLVGLYLDIAVLDEYSIQNPAIWGLVIRPALADRKGRGIFIGTARSMNHFYDLFIFAQKHPENWYARLLTVEDTKVIDEEELKLLREEMTEEQYQQEMMCSFTASTAAFYYGTYISKMYEDKRIRSVPYEPLEEVNTSWDLGVGDATAIWFFQVVGGEKRFIDYYENSGVGLEHYVRILKERDYTYGTHFLPHDAKARSLETGNTREEALRAYRIGRIRVLPKIGIDDGISAARMLLKTCYIDEVKCERGLQCLRNYQKKWDQARKIYSDVPLHDWSSNGSDAFRYASLAIRPKQGILKEQVQQVSVYENYDIF